MCSSDSDSHSMQSDEELDTGDSADELFLDRYLNRGKKRKRFNQLHKRQKNKLRKNSGKSYTNVNGTNVCIIILFHPSSNKYTLSCNI